MATKSKPRNPRPYRIGIDVGTHSVGLAAIEFASDGHPVGLLSAVSHLHDSGVLEAKTATTRLAAAGVARRTRRLRRRRVKRLTQLDRQLADWRWEPLPDNADPFLPWHARARLATETIFDPVERGAYLATALRHMARHRGWRNPYVGVASLYQKSAPSTFLAGDPGTDGHAPVLGFRQRVEDTTGVRFADNVTVSELAAAALGHVSRLPLRHGKTERSRVEREFSFLGGKLMQSDNANELHAYASAQNLTGDELRRVIDLVFAAESPRGSWVARIGRDPLDNNPRAPKATDAFQRFRIVSTLANARAKVGGIERRLDRDEVRRAYEYVLNVKVDEQPTWGDIGEAVGLARQSLAGAASLTSDGQERLPARPPVHATDHVMRRVKKLGTLRDFWAAVDSETRDKLVSLLVDGVKDESTPAGVAAWSAFDSLSDDELAECEKLGLPAGRAAYSVESLRRLTQRMLDTGDDLHEARKAVFNVSDDWVPPSEPIGAPVGNPSVDRVLKIVARFLLAAESEWGVPERVTIEHVRNAFLSEDAVRRIDRENQLRFKAKLEQRESVGSSVKAHGRVRDSDVRRFEAVQRQDGCCLYCGDPISYDSAEMDHIVPRKGTGSTNARSNLVAICVPCNRSKSNIPFAVWATNSPKPGVSIREAVERTKHWRKDSGVPPGVWSSFMKEVRDRLERTEEDPEIDARSMESVAWMANELRERIDAHFGGGGSSASLKRTFVYRGALTAEARRLAGIEGRIPWVGGGGKTRLDRRHHAVDAAVQTLLDESIARTLAERASLRESERYRRDGVETWKDYDGSSPLAKARLAAWKQQMLQMADLIATAFDGDQVVVTENLRLRLGVGPVHLETIRPFSEFIELGSEFTREQFMRLATPSLWKAVEQVAVFDETGRVIDLVGAARHHGRMIEATERLPLLPKYSQAPTPLPALAVQHGYAELGAAAIHHVRIYEDRDRRGRPVFRQLRVYAEDLRHHRNADLFAVPLGSHSISVRAADPMLHGRLDELKFLGWLVRGDEIELGDISAFRGKVARFLEQFGAVTRWRVTGFGTPAKMTLVPAQIAKEGLARDEVRYWLGGEMEPAEFVLGGNWSVAVNEVFGKGRPRIIRRDALGRERHSSRAHLPICWNLAEG